MAEQTFFALSLAAIFSGACGGRAAGPVSGAESGAGKQVQSAASASGKAAEGRPAKNAASGEKAEGLTLMVTPSKLMPELSGDRGVLAYVSGEKRVLIDRMRLVVHEDGSMERATETLPSSMVNATELPSRLGGGFLFHATNGGSTQLWRSSTWLSSLTPLVQLSNVANEIVPGFDRLYVRFAGNHRLLALDPETGESVSLGGVPPSAVYGVMAFADGWRAVIDTDLRGPMATFDAGATWQPLNIQGRATAIPIIDGDPVVIAQGGRYRVDARGAVTFRPDVKKPSDEDEGDDTALRPPGALGKRPLRTAVIDGFPESQKTAVVAQKGSLFRVSLETGAIVATREKAFSEEDASCHAVRLFAGYGFVCGEREGKTSIYAFETPFSLKAVLSFPKPRFVSPSGNGALVIRGGCTEQQLSDPSMKAYCILRADGKTREIHVRGDQLGYERVVALKDGREVVLVPPRAGNAGQMTVLNGAAMSSVALTLPVSPRSAVRDLKNGMWLEGFEEREPGVIGGWVEAGGPVVGIRISLDGKVKLGTPRLDVGGTIIGGRFALSVDDGGRAAETTDGGVSWRSFDLPERDSSGEGAPLSRACGPIGCALDGWVRVGWGNSAVEGDLEPALPPPSHYVTTKNSPVLKFDCELSGAVTPPLPPKTTPEIQAPPERPISPFGYPGPYGRRREPVPQWLAFRNTPPPALAKDEFGTDNGTAYDIVSMRAYVWGKKGADWTKVGRFLIRFDDRFDVHGGVRSSVISTSPWADEAAAMDALGITSYGLSWGAYLDPSGRAALVHACRSSGCALYAAAEGQSILPIRDPSGRSVIFTRPYAHSAVRTGETWFFLTQGTSYDSVVLWRADLGVARQIGTYSRPAMARYSALEPVRLVRRAHGSGIGLMFSAITDATDRSGFFYLIPVNPDTGALAEAVRLERKDLDGKVPSRCSPGQDGWLFDVALDNSPVVDLSDGYAALDSVELRLRMDPGAVCVEGLSARMDGTFSKQGGAVTTASAVKEIDSKSIPLAATERVAGKRWVFQCAKRGAFE